MGRAAHAAAAAAPCPDLVPEGRGDGAGGLQAGETIALPGALTAMVAGEINRPDGLVDLAAAVAGSGGPAVLVFEGVARNNFEGRPVQALDYEAFPEMAEAEMRAIGEDLAARWPGAKCAMVHRTGRLEIGEPSVIIAVGTPHRAECYAASRFAIDELKRRVPVWKKEIYADGEAWKPNAEAAAATAEPEAEPT